MSTVLTIVVVWLAASALFGVAWALFAWFVRRQRPSPPRSSPRRESPEPPSRPTSHPLPRQRGKRA